MKKKIQQILLPTNGSLDLTVVRTVNMNEEMYLSVLIGLAEIERLPYDKNHVVFKILVGRFYNTGYKLNKLSQVFGVSEKTIRKWGKALELGDVEEMNRVFGGNTNKVKLNSEILGYAKGIYNFFKGRVKNYRQLAVEAIEDKYNVSVSGERLRQLFLAENIQKENETNDQKENETNDQKENEASTLQIIQKTKELSNSQNIEKRVNEEHQKNDKKGNNSCVKSTVLGEVLSPSSNNFPFLGLPLSGIANCSKPTLLQHCGLLLGCIDNMM